MYVKAAFGNKLSTMVTMLLNQTKPSKTNKFIDLLA